MLFCFLTVHLNVARSLSGTCRYAVTVDIQCADVPLRNYSLVSVDILFILVLFRREIRRVGTVVFRKYSE